MTAIKVVICHMHDTLKEAEEYYRDYLFYKEDYPKLATVALDMSKSHIDMYQKWHVVVEDLIDEYKKDGHEVPPTMQKEWDFEHGLLIKEFGDLKKMMS